MPPGNFPTEAADSAAHKEHTGLLTAVSIIVLLAGLVAAFRFKR